MKILIYDIETSPNVVYSWAVGRKISLTPDNIIKERQIICICWKWLDQGKIYSLDWGKKKDDKFLLKEFSKVINEADVAIAHNGDKYDIKFIQGRLAYHDLPPVIPRTIDTLKQSRNAFFINSHRLDYLGQLLVSDRKLETNFKLWKDVMAGDEIALKKMIKYCKQDVKLLEEVYKKIRKYSPQTIHMGIVAKDSKLACKACGGINTKWDGHRIATKVKYRCRRCNDCGHFWRTEFRYEP